MNATHLGDNGIVTCPICATNASYRAGAVYTPSQLAQHMAHDHCNKHDAHSHVQHVFVDKMPCRMHIFHIVILCCMIQVLISIPECMPHYFDRKFSALPTFTFLPGLFTYFPLFFLLSSFIFRSFSSILLIFCPCVCFLVQTLRCQPADCLAIFKPL